MKLLNRLRFKTQIIACFCLVICLVGAGTCVMAHTFLRQNYRQQKSQVLRTHSRQLSINVTNRLEYFLSYLRLVSSDPLLLSAMGAEDLGPVERSLDQATEEFRKLNAGRVSAIRVYRRSQSALIDGLGPVEDIFVALGSRAYTQNAVITGTYLNPRHEKVFSVFQKVFQSNRDQEYCLEMCVYETELYGFFNEDGVDTDTYLFSGDSLLSMSDRSAFTTLLYDRRAAGTGPAGRDDLTLSAEDTAARETAAMSVEVLIQANSAYLERDYVAILVEMLPFFLAMLLLSFYLAVLVTRQLSRRLNRLQSQIADLSGWKLSQPIFIEGEGEFAALAQELESTRQKILALIDDNTRAQEQMHIAEMTALRAQINSHFLFNSLSTIRWLAVEGKVSQQTKAVDSLALFLRYSLEIKGNQAPLEEEIRQLSAYAYLQSLRYGEEVHLRIDVDECLMKCQTVRMILQPLVENAIYHGRRSDGSALNISIYSEYDARYYYLMIEDDGNGIAPETIQALKNGQKVSSRSGYGLENVIQRLRLCLKDPSDALLQIQSSPGEYTVITIRQPLGDAGPQNFAEKGG